MNNQDKKLCVKWNDFQENVSSAFKECRQDMEFADVTLACEDGQQVEAHKVILASSSPFFLNLLRRNKHPHPLIYMRGLKSEDLVAMIDFLYFGEANVYQENLDSFLAVAEELQLKGLTGNFEKRKSELPKHGCQSPSNKSKQNTGRPSTEDSSVHLGTDMKPAETSLVPTETLAKAPVNNDELDSTVSSMMQKNDLGLWSCSICGKSNKHRGHVKNHIEGKHIEGTSRPCAYCGKQLRSINSLENHLSVYYREQLYV